MSNIEKILAGLCILLLAVICTGGCDLNRALNRVNQLEADKQNLGIDLKTNETFGSIKVDTFYKHDTVKIMVPVKVIQVVKVDSEIFIPVTIDTDKVISNYFKLRHEVMHFDDSLINFNSWYHVFKNEVKFDSTRYDLFRTQRSISTVVKVNVHRWRWGAGFAIAPAKDFGSMQLFISANLSTRTWNYGAGYNPFAQTMMFSINKNFVRHD